MLQSNPYWFTYHPQATSIISNFDALYYRQGESSLTSPRPTLPRMFIHGLQQHVNHLSPPSVFSPENRSWFQSFPKTNFQPELRNILNVPLVHKFIDRRERLKISKIKIIPLEPRVVINITMCNTEDFIIINMCEWRISSILYNNTNSHVYILIVHKLIWTRHWVFDVEFKELYPFIYSLKFKLLYIKCEYYRYLFVWSACAQAN